MATLRDFARRMELLARNVEGGAARIVREVAVQVDAAIVLATPVDTGRARANWQVEIGTPAQGTTDATSPSGAESIAQARVTIAGAPAGQEIHITNNLPYIGKLNEGHSAQAPAGFVETAVAVGVQTVRNSRLLEGGK